MEMTAYNFSNEKLLESLDRCYWESRVAEDRYKERWCDKWHRYLQGVILSRLKGINPPIDRGQQVLPQLDVTPVESLSVPRLVGEYKTQKIDAGSIMTVAMVWYENRRWHLRFNEIKYQNDDCALFEFDPEVWIIV